MQINRRMCALINMYETFYKTTHAPNPQTSVFEANNDIIFIYCQWGNIGQSYRKTDMYLDRTHYNSYIRS